MAAGNAALFRVTKDDDASLSGLARHIVFSIFACDGQGVPTDPDSQLNCVILSGSEHLESQWQSPFDNGGGASRAPTLTAMLQTGTLKAGLPLLNMITGIKTEATSETLTSLQGRTSLTKLKKHLKMP